MSKKVKPRVITLEITEDQARVISEACELIARIKMGQLQYTVSENLPALNHEQLRLAVDYLGTLEKELYVGRGYLSISSKEVPDSARIAFDLHQVIRHHTAWKRNPKGGEHSRYNRPMKCDANNPLPIVSDKRDVLK